MQTGNNGKFIRTWFETSIRDFNYKWYPLVNGGDFRKWYGNFNELIYWYNDGDDIKKCKSSVLRNQKYYKKAGISWNRIASRGITLRFFPTGCFFDQAGDSMFCDNLDTLLICMAYLNTKVAKTFFDMLAPTINLTAGMIGKLPYKEIPTDSNSLELSKQNIQLSKQDWDAHETSWDFERNPLVEYSQSGYMGGDEQVFLPKEIKTVFNQYVSLWSDLFKQLHNNEEELNRHFIEIYGLQNELTPDVPLNEITILQQGELSIENNKLVWHSDVVMKQLISYSVGCMLGRYRLDKPGLHIAHPEPTEEEIAPYEYHGFTFEIDDDAIVPLMTNDCGFSDNASLRFAEFVRTAFGEETQVENLNFIEQCLGKTVEQYFVKDFWKDHKKMYQNRPIYWLFSSKKGAFQVIAYMHRMNAYTVERVRAKYLLPYIEHLQEEYNKLDMRRVELTTKETKRLQNLQKQLDECREYHDRLQVVAEQAISFDLDDGVIVNHAKFGDILQKIK